MTGINHKIKATIEMLKGTDIHGCITGSCMLDMDFESWAETPDIDVFTYTENQELYAIDLLMLEHGFEPLNKGERWKIERIKDRGMQKKAVLTTVKLVRDGIVVNITYKNNKTNLLSVLSSFDMSIIMKGFDIETKVMMDLRTKNDGFVPEDPLKKWSSDPMVAVPNPLRKQDVDMYGVEMWVRQWDRVLKYWSRGFDTRPMAKFYVDSINRIIDDGALFTTDKSQSAYQLFVDTYIPLRDKMSAWLEAKEDC